jgi:hypothetical protein
MKNDGFKFITKIIRKKYTEIQCEVMEQRMKSVLGALSVDVHQLGYGYKRL